MSEAEVRERKIYVFNKLKKGWKVKEIVEELIDKYQLSENYANKFAYSCNKEFNESILGFRPLYEKLEEWTNASLK